MTDVANHLTEALEALPQEERVMITDSPSLANAWLIEQSESMEQPISALLNAWERITAREDKAVETLVRLETSKSSPALNEYERIEQEERWFQSEVLKPLAIAHLRRRRMEAEGLTDEDVADWEPEEVGGNT